MKKLTKKTMEDFGFKEIWPRGNPTEPWWNNEILGCTFYCLPTDDEFLKYFTDKSYEKGKEEIRKAMRCVIGV